MNGAFIISQSDKRPMYLQIMEQIKQRIAVGNWKEGQAIPSIRQLAVNLQVSVITVKRAYLELEREGVIVTQQGKGSHVAPVNGLGKRLREQELEQHLEQARRLAALLGIQSEELEHRLREAGSRPEENKNIGAIWRSS
jgi:GntR family transcriptional regulator